SNFLNLKIYLYDMKFQTKYENILTKEFLEEKYKEYGTLSGIAKETNISYQVISRYFNKLNIPYKKLTRYTCNEKFFETPSEESFYWLGFLAADGCVTGLHSIQMELSVKDINHLEKFKKH